jgi:hypothetical protein
LNGRIFYPPKHFRKGGISRLEGQTVQVNLNS